MSIKATQDLAVKAQALFDLLSDPEQHTRTILARDDAGNKIHPSNPKATCFCLVGGIVKIEGIRNHNYYELYSKASTTPLGKLLSHIIRSSPHHIHHPAVLWQYNDNHPHAKVVTLLAVAAAYAKGAAEAGIEI